MLFTASAVHLYSGSRFTFWIISDIIIITFFCLYLVLMTLFLILNQVQWLHPRLLLLVRANECEDPSNNIRP